MNALTQAQPVQSAFDAPVSWMSKAINIVVIGAGGNGSEAVDTLASFHHALVSLGHPYGLSVTVIDDSKVREPNLVRQRFWPCDLGQYKAVVLANRYNMMLGLNWVGLPCRYPSDQANAAIRAADIVITAVDLPSARRALAAHNAPPRNCMWLDLGNDHRHGQAVFGSLCSTKRESYPSVMELFPELETLPDDNTKSCSAAESLATQDSLINRAVTTAGMSIIWDVLRYGRTTKHFISINLETGEQYAVGFPQANN